MLGVTNLWTYVVGTVAIILLPGPNSLYVLALASRRGVRQGYRAAAGVWLGDAMLMVLSAGGVASLLRTYPAVFVVVKYAGAAYLGYIGLRLVVQTWLRTRRPRESGQVDRPDGADPAAGPPSAERPFRRALAVSLLNPKAILFFVSFFIQFVDPRYPHPAIPFLILGAIAELVSVAYLTLLIFGGRYFADRFKSRRRLSAGLTAGVGAVFVAFGVRLATATLG